MPSDVVLHGEGVRFVANDLMLDFKKRRANDSPFRRALTHDYADGLTFNWDRDFPGGITMLGHVDIPDSLSVGRAWTAKLVLQVQEYFPASSAETPGPTHIDDVLQEPDPSGLGGLRDRVKDIDLTTGPGEVDLESELRRLWAEVVRLRERLGELEGTG